jgi:hypothetical protein
MNKAGKELANHWYGAKNRARKVYPLIGDDPAEPKKIEVFIKKDDKGHDILVDAEGKRLFTQDHMNTEIGLARKKAAEANKTLIEQLEELKAKASTSESMKEELQQQIENLQQANLSKEEQMVRQIKQLEENVKKTQETLTTERDRYSKLWKDERISNELRYASDEHKAFSFEQIHSLLYSRTDLKPVIDDAGKPTGQHQVVVTLDVPDKDGNIEVKQLTPSTALKVMKELPQRYGNLFVSTEAGGLGGGNASSGNIVASKTPPPEALKSVDAYNAWKAANAQAKK